MTTTSQSTGSGFLNDIGRTLRHWPAVLISGIITIIAGALVLVYQRESWFVLGLIFGIGILVQSVVFGAAALGAEPGTPGRFWIGLWAVLGIVAGWYTIAYPLTGTFALGYLLIFWLFINAVNDFTRAAAASDHRIWFIVLGVLEVIVAVWLLFDLPLAVETVVLLVSFGLILHGIGEIVVAFRLRHVNKAVTAQ